MKRPITPPTPTSLLSDFADIIQQAVNWPEVDWRSHHITIDQMARISHRIEQRLEEACYEASERS